LSEDLAQETLFCRVEQLSDARSCRGSGPGYAASLRFLVGKGKFAGQGREPIQRRGALDAIDGAAIAGGVAIALAVSVRKRRFCGARWSGFPMPIGNR